MDNLPISDQSPETDESVPVVPLALAETDQPLSIDEADTAAAESRTRPTVTFQGNSYDLTAVVGVIIGVFTLLTCMTCNFAYYLLPCLTIGLGIFGLATAKSAVDSERTKQLSWITIGAGAVIILLTIAFLLAYAGLFFLIAASSGEFSF